MHLNRVTKAKLNEWVPKEIHKYLPPEWRAEETPNSEDKLHSFDPQSLGSAFDTTGSSIVEHSEDFSSNANSPFPNDDVQNQLGYPSSPTTSP